MDVGKEKTGTTGKKHTGSAPNSGADVESPLEPKPTSGAGAAHKVAKLHSKPHRSGIAAEHEDHPPEPLRRAATTSTLHGRVETAAKASPIMQQRKQAADSKLSRVAHPASGILVRQAAASSSAKSKGSGASHSPHVLRSAGSSASPAYLAESPGGTAASPAAKILPRGRTERRRSATEEDADLMKRAAAEAAAAAAEDTSAGVTSPGQELQLDPLKVKKSKNQTNAVKERYAPPLAAHPRRKSTAEPAAPTVAGDGVALKLKRGSHTSNASSESSTASRIATLHKRGSQSSIASDEGVSVSRSPVLQQSDSRASIGSAEAVVATPASKLPMRRGSTLSNPTEDPVVQLDDDAVLAPGRTARRGSLAHAVTLHGLGAMKQRQREQYGQPVDSTVPSPIAAPDAPTPIASTRRRTSLDDDAVATLQRFQLIMQQSDADADEPAVASAETKFALGDASKAATDHRDDLAATKTSKIKPKKSHTKKMPGSKEPIIIRPRGLSATDQESTQEKQHAAAKLHPSSHASAATPVAANVAQHGGSGRSALHHPASAPAPKVHYHQGFGGGACKQGDNCPTFLAEQEAARKAAKKQKLREQKSSKPSFQPRVQTEPSDEIKTVDRIGRTRSKTDEDLHQQSRLSATTSKPKRGISARPVLRGVGGLAGVTLSAAPIPLQTNPNQSLTSTAVAMPEKLALEQKYPNNKGVAQGTPIAVASLPSLASSASSLASTTDSAKSVAAVLDDAKARRELVLAKLAAQEMLDRFKLTIAQNPKDTVEYEASLARFADELAKVNQQLTQLASDAPRQWLVDNAKLQPYAALLQTYMARYRNKEGAKLAEQKASSIAATRFAEFQATLSSPDSWSSDEVMQQVIAKIHQQIQQAEQEKTTLTSQEQHDALGQYSSLLVDKVVEYRRRSLAITENVNVLLGKLMDDVKLAQDTGPAGKIARSELAVGVYNNALQQAAEIPDPVLRARFIALVDQQRQQEQHSLASDRAEQAEEALAVQQSIAKTAAQVQEKAGWAKHMLQTKFMPTIDDKPVERIAKMQQELAKFRAGAEDVDPTAEESEGEISPQHADQAHDMNFNFLQGNPEIKQQYILQLQEQIANLSQRIADAHSVHQRFVTQQLKPLPIAFRLQMLQSKLDGLKQQSGKPARRRRHQHPY